MFLAEKSRSLGKRKKGNFIDERLKDSTTALMVWGDGLTSDAVVALMV